MEDVTTQSHVWMSGRNEKFLLCLLFTIFAFFSLIHSLAKWNSRPQRVLSHFKTIQIQIFISHYVLSALLTAVFVPHTQHSAQLDLLAQCGIFLTQGQSLLLSPAFYLILFSRGWKAGRGFSAAENPLGSFPGRNTTLYSNKGYKQVFISILAQIMYFLCFECILKVL